MNDSGTFAVFSNSVAQSFTDKSLDKQLHDSFRDVLKQHAKSEARPTLHERFHPNTRDSRSTAAVRDSRQTVPAGDSPLRENKSELKFGRLPDTGFLQLPYQVRQQLKRLTLGVTERDADDEEEARLKVITSMSAFEKNIYTQEAQTIKAYKSAELAYSRAVAEGRKPAHSPRRPPACPMHEEVDRRTVSILAKRGS
jgi:hypothetical protein